MSGDYSRQTFDPERDFSGVLMQQGRVQLDADWNELVDILSRRLRAETIDVIGRAAVPKGTPEGFSINIDTTGATLTIARGRIYVHGLLAENHGKEPVDFDQVLGEQHGTLPVPYGEQPYFPNPTPLPAPAVSTLFLVFIDVWQREVTYLEDPNLIEKAVAVDTTTRLQTVWQVRVFPTPLPAGATCDTLPPGWAALIAPSDGRLSTKGVGTVTNLDPCVLPPTGGYRGLENQLYRVEIHDGGTQGSATFKWSRDNATVATSVTAIPALDTLKVVRIGRDAVLRFNNGDWIEIIDDWLEFAQQPGVIRQIKDVEDASLTIILYQPLPSGTFSADPARHTRIRRWDQSGKVLDTNGNLIVDLDALGSSGVIPVPPTGTSIILESGVQITFDTPAAGSYHVSDYWTFAARTANSADGSVEQLQTAPPRGILHHFGRLAVAQFNGAKWSVLDNCPPTFPPLSDICAEDVCFNNDYCNLPDVKTVQDALNRLCRERDLRFHNKHLHGWGIVCGLQVNCGPADKDENGNPIRKKVTVKTGYAIDCEGNDVNLDSEQVVDVLDLAGQLSPPLPDKNGDGTVCLYLTVDPQQGIQFKVEPFDPTTNTFKSLLKGGLIMDFYTDCLLPLKEFYDNEFTTPQGSPTPLVGPTQKRVTTLLNLLIQLFNPTNGQYVLVSAEEDKILRDFHAALKELLQSHTFCAMFDGARLFPPYPTLFPNQNPAPLLHTIFGKSFHSRLRIHPNGNTAYTCGGTNTINVYDLTPTGLNMVAEVAFPTAGAIVQDVAFSSDGNSLYAAAIVNNQDTLFAVASIKGTNYIWGTPSVVCDVQLITLGTTPAMPTTLYAIGKGFGLCAFIPQATIPAQGSGMLFVGFNAVGHLVFDGPTAYATAATLSSTTGFDNVLSVDLNGTSTQTPTSFPVLGLAQDDIAVVSDSQRKVKKLYVAASPSAATTKPLVVFDIIVGPGKSTTIDLLENTSVHLAYNPTTGFLVFSFEDSYRLGLFDVQKGGLQTLPDYRYPAQISPISLAYASSIDSMCVLNYGSNTINPIPAAFLAQGLDPATQADLQNLSVYRTGVLEALADLLGGLLQYLKDCFCEHLLVNCPECDGSEKLYLGCISIKGNQVYQVCNFARRRYVKSFPTVGYWLSIIPIVPLLKKAVELLCCSTLPDLFAGWKPKTAGQQRLSGSQIRQGVGFYQQTNFRSMYQQWTGKLNVGRTLASDWALSSVRPPVPPPAQTVLSGDVVGQPVAQAQSRLGNANITVESVQPYNPLSGADNLAGFARAPVVVTPGTSVVLHEQDGIVKYYSLAEPATPAAAIQELNTKIQANQAAADAEALRLREETQALKTQLAQMQNANQQALAARDQQIAALNHQIAGLADLKTQVASLARRLPRTPPG